MDENAVYEGSAHVGQGEGSSPLAATHLTQTEELLLLPPQPMTAANLQTHFGHMTNAYPQTTSSPPADDEDDLETPKASMFLTRYRNLSTTTSSATDSGGAHLSSPLPGISRRNSSLSIREDHFPPSPTSFPTKQPTHSPQPHPHHHQHQQLSSNTGLALQPTTAISLPEGVLAQQQQPPGADRINSSRGTSITGAPSFSSDSGSLASYVPTLDGRGNDIKEMLGEILSMDEAGIRWWGDESLAVSGVLRQKHSRDLEGVMRVGMGNQQEQEAEDEGGADVEEEEESSDEERDKGMTDEARISRWCSRKKHFFILSGAGKPIYSRHGNGSGAEQMLVSGYMGVTHTIISFFQDSASGGPGDSLRSFVAGKHRFVVLREEGPLYLVAVSSLPCESEAQLRAQLDKLYSQVVATLTVSALTKIFSQREGYDLRRLLGGTEVFLDGLSDAMTKGDPGTLLGALECVRLRKRVREKVNGVMLKCRTEKLLYGMLVADGRLVGVIRPRRHTLHPMDLQVVFGMLFNSGTFRDSGTRMPSGEVAGGGGEGLTADAAGGASGGSGEHWTPICLPKFNSKGYLYAYIHFWRRELAIVLISADSGSFFELRGMKESFVAKLDAPDTSLPPPTPPTRTGTSTPISAPTSTSPPSLTSIIESALSANRYSVDEVLRGGIRIAKPLASNLSPTPPPPPHSPGSKGSGNMYAHTHSIRVLHFLYKSRRNIQFTMPSYEPHFSNPRAKRKLMSVYQALHSKIHRGIGGGAAAVGLKVHFERFGAWLVGAWVEKGGEVYVVAQGRKGVGGGMAGCRGGGGGGGDSGRGEGCGGLEEGERRGLVEAAARIVWWVGKEEERCFVVGGGVF